MIAAMDEQLRSQLDRFLGKSFHFGGRHLLVHELLVEQDTLVLMSLDEKPSIQNNQYGEPHRRTPEMISVSMNRDSQGELHPLIQFLIGQ